VTPAVLLSAALVLAQPPAAPDLAVVVARMEALHRENRRFLDSFDARLAALEKAQARPPARTKLPPGGEDDPDTGPTYEVAYARAAKRKQPLVVWVGGDFCPRCVAESERDFVHYFAPDGRPFGPGLANPSILVYVPDGGEFRLAGQIDWWITGDKEFGHLASIRNAIRRWRDRRLATREAGAAVYQPAARPAVVPQSTAFVPLPAPAASFARVPRAACPH
jgi:hypothetical protein